ncbi:hypothetical protein ACWEK2_03805 [Streptomyces albidoflavus]
MSRLRPAADRLARGTGRLATGMFYRALAWVRRGYRADLTGVTAHLGDLARATVVLGGLFFLARAVRATPTLMWLVAGVCLLAAWWAGRPIPGVDIEKPPAEGAEEAPDEAPAEAPLPTREELAVALHAVADPNVHTAALAAHMKLPAERVRAALKAAGIPAGGGVRMGGVTSTGIKAGHFPPLPPSGEGAPEPVVVAGQASNNSNNNAVRVKRGEGTVTIYDPSDSHRHHRVA